MDYGTEPADAAREVPNPERSKINAELRKAKAHLEQIQAHCGIAALENREDRRPTMRGFKIANAATSARVRAAIEQITELKNQRATLPVRVPVQEVVEADVIKLSVERKHLTDILKMVAYQAAGDLLRLLSPHYRRSEQEGRTLIQSAFAAGGEELNATATQFPGTELRMRFAIKPAPPRSLAFPGPRNTSGEAQPDI